MDIYNKDKTTILDKVDLSLGYLKNDTIIHPATPSIEEQGHYELIQQYEHGASYDYVIDVEGQEARPERIENIKVYIPYTTEELNKQALEREMTQLKIDWFDGHYTEHEQKYRRLHTLGLKTDEGKDAYTALTELYQEAEAKRKRIQEIEAILSE